MASWTAAATSYSTHGLAMLPFYIYYSMFGFQRVGDMIWAAADQRSRGFLIGATAGRTTLGGEGLQHQDGHSHLVAGAVPNCVAYDPAFAYELAVIVEHGMQRMLLAQEDRFYYVTVTNESLPQPSLPDGEGVRDGIVRGAYRLPFAARASTADECTLLGSGAIFYEVLAAAELLGRDWGVSAHLVSVTSFSELARDGMACDRARHWHGDTRAPHVTQVLADTVGPVVAATDYVRAVPEQIRAWVPSARRYVTLGTDGFGRSDGRRSLREFFEIDRHHVVWRALHALGRVADAVLARERYALVDIGDPWRA